MGILKNNLENALTQKAEEKNQFEFWPENGIEIDGKQRKYITLKRIVKK